MIKGLVSVIIPTTDKEKHHLERCVKSVRDSDYKNVEIIVVNEGKERSAQRNIGIDRAQGEFLLFLDSDQLISRGLIAQAVADNSFMPFSIYFFEAITTPGFFGRLRNWERQFYTGTAVDVVRFVRSEGCPRFDETMSGPEDSDWDRRIKDTKKVGMGIIFHHDEVTLISYLRKKAYYSKSMKRFAEKWPNDKVLNFWWRCFGVYFERGKWRHCLRRPDLFMCLMGLVFIRGVVYVWNTR